MNFPDDIFLIYSLLSLFKCDDDDGDGDDDDAMQCNPHLDHRSFRSFVNLIL